MTRTLTEGSPLKLIFEFSIPVILGNLFQQFYSLADTMIIGRCLGLKELAGVGTTNALTFLVINTCVGICGGFAIPVSQAFGAGDHSRMRKCIYNGILLTAVMSIFFATVTGLGCQWLLTIMHTPKEIFQYAYDYILVIFIGIPATLFYNYLASVIRALGDSKTPLIMLIVSAFLNIGLDFLLIFVIPMGVAGTALATVLSQGVSILLCLYALRRISLLRTNSSERKISTSMMKIMLKNGIPMGLTSAVTAIGVAILQVAVNEMGTVTVAAVASADKLYGIIAGPIGGFGVALAAFAGQNTGAGDGKRVGEGLKAAMILSVITSMIMLAFTFFFGKYLIMLFVNASETVVISKAHMLMTSWALAFVLLSCQQNFIQTIQGMGFSVFSLVSGGLEVVGRALSAVWLTRAFGFVGVCAAVPFAWLLAGMFLIPVYFMCKKKRFQEVRA